MEQLKMFLLSSMIVFFTACGGGVGAISYDTNTTYPPLPINKIKSYADDDTQPVPTIEDYINVGVTGVTIESIDNVNEGVASLTSNNIDTKEEIQQIVNDLGINIPPEADAGADKSVELNQAITITGSGTDIDGIIVAYVWTKNDVVIATTASFNYTPTTIGTETLVLTVMDDDGETASDSMNVLVTASTAF